ncbi:MAG: zinc-ribbon domain-containing protein [Pyrinomonadaceae bacterium]|nr:zinc-ribbon domain-containing protein [Pyrinomonadaceae bacterium]
MIIRCDNCSVSLQLDESKVPAGHFTVRCPRCQNLIRVNSKQTSTVQQLEANVPAPAVEDGKQEFSAKEQEFEINNAMRSLLSALQKENKVLDANDESGEKPRRVLLCLGQRRDAIAKVLVDSGYKVYLAQTPAQANERMREGKTEILVFSPDFAAEFGGAAILQQKLNAMYSSERRRLFLVLVEDNGATLNAHEAFIRNLNLIVNTADIPKLPLILNRALRDFNELYHYFNEATGAAAI